MLLRDKGSWRQEVHGKCCCTGGERTKMCIKYQWKDKQKKKQQRWSFVMSMRTVESHNCLGNKCLGNDLVNFCHWECPFQKWSEHFSVVFLRNFTEKWTNWGKCITSMAEWNYCKLRCILIYIINIVCIIFVSDTKLLVSLWSSWKCWHCL